MNLSDCSLHALLKKASSTGFCFKTGPFNVRLKTNIKAVVAEVQKHYAQAPLMTVPCIEHFDISLFPMGILRQWVKPKVLFTVDGVSPFEPFPIDQAFPHFEWGLNWCIGTTSHNWLLLHSAAVEYKNHVLLLPATPGSGKSTLCSGLISRGWRLLSDEFGIIDHKTGHVIPLPRSIPLKNQSIDVMKRFTNPENIGKTYNTVRKGDVAHYKPPQNSIFQQNTTAPARWLVFPKFKNQAVTELTPIDKSSAFIKTTNNSFNYHLLMQEGFNTLAALVENCECYNFEYSNLEDAVNTFTTLAERSL